MASASTSIRWFIAHRFLGACLPYLPVASLCLAARGLGWSQVLKLAALYAVASAVLVLPVTAIAQRIGTRRTLIGGAIAVAIGAVLAACATDLETMAIAQLAFAVAAAVDAGADSAYLWSLLGHDREAYRRAEARSTAGKLAGGVLGIALGGALVTWSPAAPFAAAAVFAIGAAVCASRLTEVTADEPVATLRSLPAAARALMIAAGGRKWLVIGIVSCAVARVMASAIGPLLADAGLATTTATAVATGAAVIAAIAAALTGGMTGTWRRVTLFGAPAALSIVAIALASAHGATAAAMVAVLPVIAAVLGPLWRAHLNQQAPENAPRLLMLGVDATMVRLVAAVLPLIVTGTAPRAGVASLGVALVVVLLAVAAAAILRDRRVRLAVIAVVALAVPQLATADVPAWSAPQPALCTDAITIDKPLGMGTTIKFKAHAGATKVVVRPAQTRDAGNYRADVAGYELATALGLATVPYGCVARIDRAALEAVAGTELRRRLADEVRWDDDDTAAISVVAWVDGIKSTDLERTRGQWREQLAQHQPLAEDVALRAAAAEGSRLAVWDFLIANWDRWSGGNTFRLGADGDYVWLDNAAGFGRELARTRNARAATLRTTERFSRSLIESLRALDGAALRDALAAAGLADARFVELEARRDLILAHVDAMIARHGEDAVLAFD